ncbi:hypothetical protein BDV29DRAFT_184141 [Aspergillus leporis]|uniref:Uncharacterized protein n=1 Tax=Aspergillus leporis TaxID=41062 RepID=A0A5N5WK18_9EURO|nr:hypothetical protein BDV29DRAFT_184141 [Aspergillus leporis]
MPTLTELSLKMYTLRSLRSVALSGPLSSRRMAPHAIAGAPTYPSNLIKVFGAGWIFSICCLDAPILAFLKVIMRLLSAN